MDGTYGFNAARCSSWMIFSALTALIDGFDGLGTFSKTAYEEIPTSDTVNAHYHDIPTATWRITSYRLLTFILMILSCAAQRSLYFEHICYPSMGQMLLSQAITSMCNYGASSLTHWTFSVQSPIHLDPYYSFSPPSLPPPAIPFPYLLLQLHNLLLVIPVRFRARLKLVLSKITLIPSWSLSTISLSKCARSCANFKSTSARILPSSAGIEIA
jgi:hypothetical protein